MLKWIMKFFARPAVIIVKGDPTPVKLPTKFAEATAAIHNRSCSITIQLSPKELEVLKDLAKKKDLSINMLMIQALRTYQWVSHHPEEFNKAYWRSNPPKGLSAFE